MRFTDILRVGAVGAVSTLQTSLTLVLTTGLVGVAGLGLGAGLLWLSVRSAAAKRAALESGEQS